MCEVRLWVPDEGGRSPVTHPSLPYKNLPNPIPPNTNHQSPIPTPRHITHPLPPHRPMTNNILRTNPLLQAPEPDTRVVARAHRLPAILRKGEGGDGGGVREHGVGALACERDKTSV